MTNKTEEDSISWWMCVLGFITFWGGFLKIQLAILFLALVVIITGDHIIKSIDRLKRKK